MFASDLLAFHAARRPMANTNNDRALGDHQCPLAVTFSALPPRCKTMRTTVFGQFAAICSERPLNQQGDSLDVIH